jgi:hypothetical protein
VVKDLTKHGRWRTLALITEELSMTEYNFVEHRKDCIAKAIDLGYLENAYEARKYDLCDDGQFHLKEDMFTWFATHVNICHYEER